MITSVGAAVTLFCDKPVSEFIPAADARWFFTSNEFNNKTIALNGSVVIRRQCDRSLQYLSNCRQRLGLYLGSVERQDAGLYVCVVFGHRGPSRRINLYNVTYLLRVYGQAEYWIGN